MFFFQKNPKEDESGRDEKTYTNKTADIFFLYILWEKKGKKFKKAF